MYQFDVKDATLKCVEWIKEFFEKMGQHVMLYLVLAVEKIQASLQHFV